MNGDRHCLTGLPTITFEDEARGKYYKLNDEIATLLVRPRGWHMVEKHVLVDGEEAATSDDTQQPVWRGHRR